MESENIHGTSYANCSAKAIYKKGSYGYNVKPKHRFKSLNQDSYVPKNNRRIGKFKTFQDQSDFFLLSTAGNKDMAPTKDYDDYSTFINDAYKSNKDDLMMRASHSFDRERQKTVRLSHKVNPYSNFSVTQTSGTVASSFDAAYSTVIPATARDRQMTTFKTSSAIKPDLNEYISTIVKPDPYLGKRFDKSLRAKISQTIQASKTTRSP